MLIINIAYRMTFSHQMIQKLITTFVVTLSTAGQGPKSHAPNSVLTRFLLI